MARKDKKAEGAGQPEWPHVSVAAHPRAARSVRTLKAWCGLLAFALVGLLSWRAGVEPFEVGLRALAAGVVGYLAGWVIGVTLWQRIVLAEAKAEAERRRDERRAVGRTGDA
jgi:hypothetical protein